MARPKSQNNTKDIICLNCKTTFNIPNYKNRQFCSVKCSQQYTKSKNKNWLSKRDVTNTEKYGVKSPLESESVRQKYQNNLIVKYGVNNPFLVDEFRIKANETIKERYGAEFANQNKEIAYKISEALKGRVKDRTKTINIRWEK